MQASGGCFWEIKSVALQAFFFTKASCFLKKKLRKEEIHELNSRQRHFSWNVDEFLSNYSNWRCDEDYTHLFICKCM